MLKPMLGGYKSVRIFSNYYTDDDFVIKLKRLIRTFVLLLCRND